MPNVIGPEGVELFVSDWGPASGAPIVFAHAWGLSGDMWSCQIPDLVDAGFRCVTFDRRGHGRSDRSRNHYDLDILADDLAAVVETLDLNGMVLVGHSMGVQEVVRYLSRHGARRSAGLVLSAPATPVLVQLPDYPDGAPEALLDGQSAAIRSDIGAFIDTTASMEDYFGPAEVSKHFDDWTRRQIMETPLFVLLETHRTYTRSDLRAEISSLDLPTMVIQGDADKSAPIEVTGRPTAALLRKGELVLIEEAGHGVYASRAGRYNEELVRFATEVTRS